MTFVGPNRARKGRLIKGFFRDLANFCIEIARSYLKWETDKVTLKWTSAGKNEENIAILRKSRFLKKIARNWNGDTSKRGLLLMRDFVIERQAEYHFPW